MNEISIIQYRQYIGSLQVYLNLAVVYMCVHSRVQCAIEQYVNQNRTSSCCMYQCVTSLLNFFKWTVASVAAAPLKSSHFILKPH